MNDCAGPGATHLCVFDLDGTLLPGTTASVEMAKCFGTVDELLALEREFSRGTMTTKVFAEAIAQLWSPFRPGLVRQAFQTAPKLERIEETTGRVRHEGGLSCLITMSPNFFADHLHELGFDMIFASTFTVTEDGILTTENILCPEDKPRIVQHLCQVLGIHWDHCVAFGDSCSDEPLFRLLANTVGVNPTKALAEIAAVTYHGSDLLAAFETACEQLRDGSKRGPQSHRAACS